MKTLYLLRHAKAEPGGKEVPDRDRTLNSRGRDAALRIGAYMKEKGYRPALVLCSPAERTRETLTRVLQAAGQSPEQRFEDKLYLATAGEILHQAQKASDMAESLLIIGHNPGMHHAALTFGERLHTSVRALLELKYPTCALAVLRFNVEHWKALAPGQGELVDFVTPSSLA